MSIDAKKALQNAINFLTGTIDTSSRAIDDWRDDVIDVRSRLSEILMSLARAERAETAQPRRLIGYTTQHDLEYPFQYPDVGPEDDRNARVVPVYVGEQTEKHADAAAVEVLLKAYLLE